MQTFLLHGSAGMIVDGRGCRTLLEVRLSDSGDLSFECSHESEIKDHTYFTTFTFDTIARSVVRLVARCPFKV